MLVPNKRVFRIPVNYVILVKCVIKQYLSSGIYNLPNAYYHLLEKYFLLRIKAIHTLGVLKKDRACIEVLEYPQPNEKKLNFPKVARGTL